MGEAFLIHCHVWRAFRALTLYRLLATNIIIPLAKFRVNRRDSTMDWSLVIAALLLVIFYAYARLRRQLNYWSDRGVFVDSPSVPFGNLKAFGKRHFADVMQTVYNKYAGRDVFCGFYFAVSARAMILDLDLLKHVLIKDFQYFADRKSYFNERDDPLSAHLFNIRGAKWRLMRQQLSPTFTSGKMKMMFDLVAGETENLVQATERKIGSDIDCKDLFMRYIADVIGLCAFGLDCKSLSNEDAAIIKMGHKVFELNNLAFLFQSTFEDLAIWLKMPLFKKEATDYFYSVIKNTVDDREKNNIKRKDFINLLIELKNHGKFVDDNESENLGKITFNELAAQAFIFMVAGFETTSTTMQFCLLELAKNPEIQQRARDEINEVLRKNNGKFTYDSLQDLHYLNMCINGKLCIYLVAFFHYHGRPLFQRVCENGQQCSFYSETL